MLLVLILEKVMGIKLKQETEEQKVYMAFIEKTTKIVQAWPEWMKCLAPHIKENKNEI
jgi:hypothetical protein